MRRSPVAFDSNCINNVNEFYSHHYLDALLEGDLKGILARWDQAEKEENRPPPYKALSRCSEEFFKAKARATTTATDEDRFTETHAINVKLAEALGYSYQSGEYELIEDDLAVPVLASLQRDGNPYLWLVEAPWADEDHEPLRQRLVSSQMPSIVVSDGHKFPFEPWEDLLSLIFRREQPPRWVILLAGSLIFLVERHKWGQGKYLLFNVDELLGTKADCLKSTAAFLSKDTLCPDDGTVLHDTLDDNSHKHAFAVSGDLKYGLRHAVELLANEYVFYQRTVAKQALFGDDDLARKLTVESLTYLYRLLFLFYAEARGEQVGVLPMKSDEYREGYSLESLRDLEQVPLTTETAQNTYFIDHSLRMLFKLVNDGFQPDPQKMLFKEELPDWWHRPAPVQRRLDFDGKQQTATAAAVAEELPDPPEKQARYIDHGFTITGLESPLFDAKRTPLLSSVKFRNVVLQEVIQLLSLSREGGRGNRRRERGRISYAELGINQLGAVYEGLLSYSGFFAQERLYEVKTAGASPTDETQQSYFVPESEIAKYNEDEFVYEDVHGEREGRSPPEEVREGHVYLPPGRTGSAEVGQLLHARMPDPVRRQVCPQGTAQGQDGRRHPQADHLRAGDGFGGVHQRGDQSACRRLPRTQAEGNGPDDLAGRLPGGKTEGEGVPGHAQLLRRGLEPHRRRTGQGVALAQHDLPRLPLPVVRPAPDGRQQPDRGTAAGLQGRRPEAEEQPRTTRTGLAWCPSMCRSGRPGRIGPRTPSITSSFPI